ncbi:MAG: hypothetical protein KAX49_02795 [Halanaerobiales bacterium]|nr:hypothetical protein [Halanaerobiales bacterium]
MIQLYYWMGLIIILGLGLIILVPIVRIRQLVLFGLLGGIGLAVVVFYIAGALNLWRIVEGYDVMGIPLLPVIAWFFPVVIFGNFFPKNDSLLSKVIYILVFAVGSVITNYIFVFLGMWKSINWNYLYTFFLAFTSHSLLTLYIMYTEQYLKEK